MLLKRPWDKDKTQQMHWHSSLMASSFTKRLLMKKLTSQLLIAAAVTAGSTLFSSCDKEDKEIIPRKDLLVGTWTLNAYGQDDNNNGMLETSEYDSIPPGVNIIETFRSDKTGTVTTTNSGGSSSYNMTWALQNEDKELVISNDNNGNSTTTVISRLTENEFMGYDPSSPIRIIYLLTK